MLGTRTGLLLACGACASIRPVSSSLPANAATPVREISVPLAVEPASARYSPHYYRSGNLGGADGIVAPAFVYENCAQIHTCNSAVPAFLDAFADVMHQDPYATDATPASTLPNKACRSRSKLGSHLSAPRRYEDSVYCATASGQQVPPGSTVSVEYIEIDVHVLVTMNPAGPWRAPDDDEFRGFVDALPKLYRASLQAACSNLGGHLKYLPGLPGAGDKSACFL